MKRYVNLASTCIAIILAPLWGGFLLWYLIAKEGMDEDFLNGKKNFFIDAWKEL